MRIPGCLEKVFFDKFGTDGDRLLIWYVSSANFSVPHSLNVRFYTWQTFLKKGLGTSHINQKRKY